MKTEILNKTISDSSNLLNLTAALYPLLRMYDDGNELEIRFGHYDGDHTLLEMYICIQMV